ncbi:MAG: L-threonylcarbamoyladenylate synthase [Candidatus Anstonellaceae archaeon]
MKTQVFKVSKRKPNTALMKQAAAIIRKGGLVAFPTETVYGLGADALNPSAVKKIFQAKRRPKDDPLIVHIARKSDLQVLVKRIPSSAKKLIAKFWPGPLTLIMQKSQTVPYITTAGLETVAIRMPDHAVAQLLIKLSKTPIAAPSANLFGRPSPTSAEHVLSDLGGKIDAIIDAGTTKIGVESSVVDVTVDPPALLRPGGISFESLRKAIGKIQVLGKDKLADSLKAKSPGTAYKHYAPKAKLILVLGKKRSEARKKIIQLASKFAKKKVGVLVVRQRFALNGAVVLFAGRTNKEIAKNLFSMLRKFDKLDVDVILAEGTGAQGLGFAVLNRLKKAASKVIQV